MNKNKYTSAPLPFQGQKREWNDTFKKVLNERYDPSEFDVIIDLFGGSGLLSRWAKDTFPDKRVIWNDYDNVKQRYDNLDDTNYFYHQIKNIYKLNGIDNLKNGSKIPDEVKTQIIEMLKQEQENGRYLDFITLSSFLLFSGNYVKNIEDLEKSTFYQRIRKSEIPNFDDFLDGIDRVSMDWRDLLEMYGGDRTLIIADPPYLSTNCDSYKNHYWRLKDYLDINLEITKNYGYIFFTSDKSNILELIEWLEKNFNIELAKNKKIYNRKIIINNNKYGENKYQDYLITSKRK